MMSIKLSTYIVNFIFIGSGVRVLGRYVYIVKIYWFDIDFRTTTVVKITSHAIVNFIVLKEWLLEHFKS